MYEYQEDCRICNGNLEDKLSLGELYPSGFMKPGEKWPERAPLTLAECQNCGLVQLRHTVPLDSMYRQYWYRSGLNASMRSDLKDVVTGIEREIAIVDKDVVLDIGCNDGTLFDFYTDKEHIIKIGYDPAQNLEDAANRHTDYFINDYFSADFILERFGPRSVKVITAIAMFYDLPDPNWFLQEIKKILHPEGIFIVQFTDLLSMLRLNAFDNVCHEHLTYYSLKVLNRLMRENNLEIFRVEYNKVNGGSLRTYIQHAETSYHAKISYPIDDSIIGSLEIERLYLEQFDDPLIAFEQRIETIKEQVLGHLYNAINIGGITEIHALGASTKGNTLLQYFGLTNKTIPYAAEINEDKYGLVTVGSNIYILSEIDSLCKNPAIYICLPWHFRNFFESLPHIQNYINNGGILLYPLPEPEIETNKGVFKL